MNQCYSHVLSKQPFVLRCDDFDPRIQTADSENFAIFKNLHRQFIEAGKIMTITVNSAINFCIGFDKGVCNYINEWTAPGKPMSLDIQLHGWSHEEYWAMDYREAFLRLYANLTRTKEEFIYSHPRVFSPPWNHANDDVKRVCDELGLALNDSNLHLHRYIWGREDCNVLYWHWWDRQDREDIKTVLKKWKEKDAATINDQNRASL